MYKSFLNNKSIKTLATVATSFVVSSSLVIASETSFNAYPGTYKATFVKVEAANIIHISAKVWTGFPKQLRITLPDIAVPEDHPTAPACQAKMAQDALDLATKFMTDAKKVQVKDIYMENTASMDASTNIVTDAGKLSDALFAKGLARSSSINKKQPWC